MATLIDIVQAAFGELGDLDVPSTAVANSDPSVTQMVALLNAAGRELVRAHDWGALQVVWTFPTVAGQSDYALPADYARLIDETQWDRSTRWPLIGPITPQLDRAQRESGLGTPGLRRDFRLIGSTLRLFPTPPSAGDVMALEYMSRFWVNGAAERFSADTDTCCFDFDLMVKEAKWRWRSAQKLDAQAERSDRDIALEGLIAADLGGPTLDMGGGMRDRDWQVEANTDPNWVLGASQGGFFLAPPGLPDSPPSDPGALWDDGGLVAISQP